MEPIFISHSAADASLSKALNEAIITCLPRARGKIFNTSISGSGLAPADTVSDQVREQILGCRYFFAILTPQSIRSAWVMLECGAAWANKKKPFLLVHPEVEIPGPFRDVHVIKLAEQDAELTIYGIVERIARELSLGRPTHDGIPNIKRVLELALRPVPISDTALELNKQTNIAVLDRTFRFIERWESDQLRAARDKARVESRQLSFEEVREDENLERSVTYMFNYFEELYYAMKHDAVDSDVAVDALGDVFISALHTYRPWLEKTTRTDKRYLQKLDALKGRLESYQLPPI